MITCPKCGTHFKPLGIPYHNNLPVLSCRNGHTPETVEGAIVRGKESEVAWRKQRQALRQAA